MRFLMLSVIVFLCASAAGKPDGTSHVITHSGITIVTDQKTGINHYRSWGLFPEKQESIRKIILHLTLAHPDSLPIAHWDYLDFIKIRKTGGKAGKDLNYEIARMLTPYGSIFGKNWTWTWKVDVTDFSAFLRDSVEIEYGHSGYEPSTVGWSLTLDFEIVRGKEIARQVSVTPLWTGNFRYGDPKEDIEEKLAPWDFITGKETAFSRFRINQTGHGMDRPKGCSEFCSRWREIVFNGKIIDRTDLWKNCGNNPLYPQGGTWIYDRADWCPGELQQPRIYDLETAPGRHTLDIEMEPYAATGEAQASENIASWLIQYAAPNSRYDVALEQILIPNSDPQYSRFNPAVGSPRIVIRNLGREVLKQLLITYSTMGYNKKTFRWNGNLSFNRADTITLPGVLDFSLGENTFEASCRIPGATDGWPADNSLSAKFNAPKVLPEHMILQFLTNNKPEENDIIVSDHSGREIFSRSHVSLKSQRLYNDTLFLPEGQYQLSLTDTKGDGLEFWYEAESGYGYLRLLTPDGRILHSFEPDCGDGQFLAFSTSPGYQVDTTVNNSSFVLFPRRVKDLIYLDFHSDRPAKTEVVITADGVVVETHRYVSLKAAKLPYDLSYLRPGRYIMEVFIDGESKFKRRFNKE